MTQTRSHGFFNKPSPNLRSSVELHLIRSKKHTLRDPRWAKTKNRDVVQGLKLIKIQNRMLLRSMVAPRSK
jgi:hypothetical protein